MLDAIDGVIALHDRQVPGSRGNIDHIAICATGIWGIDAKRYVDAKVEFHDAGGWFRTDERLLVGGRDRTKLVKDLSWQIEAVRKAVPDTTVPVRGLLCFVESNWNWFAKPFSVRDVAVCWPLALPDLLRREGPLDRSACSTLARKLATTLPPA